tara:strand:- start:520 stop:1179 length:660 start_codon:yes stop_codon:yes gene_type:complete
MHPYLEKYKLLFKEPDKFYKSVSKETGYVGILKFFVVFYVGVNVISIILNLPSLLSNGILLLGALGGLIGAVIAGIIMPFVVSGIVHLGVIVFKGTQGYYNTFKAVTYAFAISFFYSIISTVITSVYHWFNPIDLLNPSLGVAEIQPLWITIIAGVIGIVSLIHVLKTEVKGVSLFQKMEMKKAWFAVILVPAVIFVLIFILGLGLGAMSTLFSGVNLG